jgi:hypothetical protein
MNLSQKMKNLRERYLSGLARIKTEKKICAAVQEEMREECSHLLTIHFLYERDKGNTARRMCWVCGLLEEGGAITKRGYISGWKFKLLTAKPFTSLLASSDSVERIMTTPVENLLEELAKIQLEYLAD